MSRRHLGTKRLVAPEAADSEPTLLAPERCSRAALVHAMQQLAQGMSWPDVADRLSRWDRRERLRAAAQACDRANRRLARLSAEVRP